MGVQVQLHLNQEVNLWVSRFSSGLAVLWQNLYRKEKNKPEQSLSWTINRA